MSKLGALDQCRYCRYCDLPFPKSVIRRAIAQALLDAPEGQHRNSLEVCYIALEFFVPDHEYNEDVRFFDLGRRMLEGHLSVRDFVESPEVLRLSKTPFNQLSQRMDRCKEELDLLRRIAGECASKLDSGEILQKVEEFKRLQARRELKESLELARSHHLSTKQSPSSQLDWEEFGIRLAQRYLFLRNKFRPKSFR